MKARLLSGAFLLGLLSTLSGCPSSSGGPADLASSATPPASAAGSAAPHASQKSPVQAQPPNPYSIPIGVPFPADPIIKAVNPKSEMPYSGPTGTLKGVIRMEGDPPPETGVKIPSKCAEGAATYGKLFRVGLDKSLADAMVAVTGYQGFVPAKGEAAKAIIHGCAVAKRTVVATYGQRIEVANLDHTEAYMPFLAGAPAKTVMVAVPMGDAVKLYPQEPGHYLIKDQLNDFLTADVFVLAYPTVDVTGLDGHYEIKDIPVGHVKVSAFLPATGTTVEKEIDIKAGENTLDLTLKYDKSGKDAAGAPAASASAKPAAPSPGGVRAPTPIK